MLRNNCTLVKNAVKIVKNSNVNVFEKKAAEAVKNHDISILDEKMTFIFNEQITETLRIDKSFNFCYLQ